MHAEVARRRAALRSSGGARRHCAPAERRLGAAATAASVEIGGKTGTGDHRYDVYGKGGQMISSRVVNRTATFVFLIGDRYFGTVMAYVHGPDAANYKFTSAMPAQLLKAMAPALMPLLAEGCRADVAAR